MALYNSELNGIGEFICLSYPSPQLESLFFDEVKRDDLLDTLSSCFIELPNLDVDLVEGDEEEEVISESASVNDNEESTSYNSDEWSYDERNAPRVGNMYQLDLNKVITDTSYEDQDENYRAGELIWDPSAVENSPLHDFLSKTEAPAELSLDEFSLELESDEEKLSFDSNGRTIGGSSVGPLDDNKPHHKLCTREEAMIVLHKTNYNVSEAVGEMRNNNQIWAHKKRPLAKWSKSDVEAFERGMRTHHKEFSLIKKHEMSKSSKTTGEILHYYYVWKKLPRYNLWLNRKRSSSLGSQNIYSTQSAPIKHDEPNRNSADPRLRNRPRIDYSQSSNGNHFWIPVNTPPGSSYATPSSGERKRKRKEYTDEFEGDPGANLGVFDVSVYAGIDYEKLRQIKRQRLGEEVPVSSNEIDDTTLLDDFLVSGLSSSDNESFWDDNDNVDGPSNGLTSTFENIPSSLNTIHLTNEYPTSEPTTIPGKQAKSSENLHFFSIAEGGWEPQNFNPMDIINSDQPPNTNLTSKRNVSLKHDPIKNNSGVFDENQLNSGSVSVEDNCESLSYETGFIIPNPTLDLPTTNSNTTITDSFINTDSSVSPAPFVTGTELQDTVPPLLDNSAPFFSNSVDDSCTFSKKSVIQKSPKEGEVQLESYFT